MIFKIKQTGFTSHYYYAARVASTDDEGYDHIIYLHRSGKQESRCHTLPDPGPYPMDVLCAAENSGWCDSLDEVKALVEKYGHTWELALEGARV